MKAKYKGFTLIEITLVMVLISILIAITTPLVSNVIARNDVGSAHEALYNALLRAQQLSKNQYKDSQWRVCLDNANKQYTITSGTCSDPTNAEIIKIASNITISSDQTLDILFKAISGELDNTANSITTTLTGGGASKSIIIDKKGILSKGSTPQSIPTIPPLTVTSCTYADKKISIPYTSGRVGYTYSSQSINSTGVTGLTATLSAGDGPLATGGDTVTDIVVGVNTTYRVHTFTTVGTSSLNVIQGGEFEYLVVGGGGSGGRGLGGGGGAGGYLTSTINRSSGSYLVVVGAGGASITSNDTVGNNGEDSRFDTIIATGGGGGGAYAGKAAKNGGSGGGGGGNEGSGTQAGGSGNTPTTTPSQGNNGGIGGSRPSGTYFGSGGGGGAGGVGGSHVTTTGGAGGPGLSSSITGTAIIRAGGGGGNGYSGAGGAAGSGGGGKGGDGNVSVTSATANTGGGGGGSGYQNSGAGGSGIVIVRYKSFTY